MNLKSLLENSKFELFIIVLILINAVTLGMQTSEAMNRQFGLTLDVIDRTILSVFVVELLARLWVYRMQFFRDPWRNFDLIIVTISLAPAPEGLSVLRTLRILRALRLITMMPALRRVVSGLIAALPGVGATALLLGLFFYVFAVLATNWFGTEFPQIFGSIDKSLYTMFQVMTLESWSTTIVRPILEVFPLAWIFFVTFIVCATFVILSMFIGIIVLEVHEQRNEEKEEEKKQMVYDNQAKILAEIDSLRQQLRELSEKK